MIRTSILSFFLLLAGYVMGQGQTCATATAIDLNVVYTLDTVWGGSGAQNICSGTYSVHAVWYVFTAPYSGPATVTSCLPGTNETGIDTQVSVFTGTCGSLGCLGSDNNNPCWQTWFPYTSSVSFNMVAGQTYYIQWDNEFMRYEPVRFQWTIKTCESEVRGTVYKDFNANGTKEEGEPLYQGLLEMDGQPTNFVNGDPYVLCTPFGDHTLSLIGAPANFEVVPADRNFTTNSTTILVEEQDFALTPIPGIYDGSVSIWGQSPWVGNTTSIWLSYSNVGTETITASLELHLDPILQYVSANMTPATVAGNTIVWDLGELPIAEDGLIHVTVETPTTAQADIEIICWTILQVQEADINGTNNLDELKLPIVAAFDPNEKHVSEHTITPEDVADEIRLDYTVHFQNTGTAPAVNVIVRDSIPEGLDLSSFQMIGATHDHVMTLQGREITWTFPGIMLPDSTTDFEESQGALHFSFTVENDLVPGDLISNNARIYFDFADPVITNPAVTAVMIPTSISSANDGQQLQMYPNPVKAGSSITIDAGSLTLHQIRLMDLQGKQLMQMSGSWSGRVNVPMPSAAPGLYLIEFEHEEGSFVRMVGVD